MPDSTEDKRFRDYQPEYEGLPEGYISRMDDSAFGKLRKFIPDAFQVQEWLADKRGFPSVSDLDADDLRQYKENRALEREVGDKLAERRQELRDEIKERTISDIDLDNMTKPAGEEAVEEEIDVEKYLRDRGRERKDITRAQPMSMRGVSSMQQKDFPYATPDQQKNVVNEIRKGLEDPARAMSEGATAEEVEIVKNMTDAQLLEFVEAMNQETMDEDTGEETLEDKALRLVDPSWEEFPTPFVANAGGRVQNYNLGGIASMGRGGDSQLAHVMTGERMVPPGVMDDGMMDAAFVRAGLDPREYTVGSAQASTNPMTGMPEYGLGSFIKRLFKKAKKLAPAIGALVGFRYGGAKGAGIGKAIGGVIKTGDLDFQRALSDFGTGWALGNFATGMGMQQGPLFKKGTYTIEQGDTLSSIAKEFGVTEQEIIDANPGAYGGAGGVIKIPGKGMWGLSPTPGGEGIGGFIQSAGAKLAGGKDINLMEQFKDLPMKQKLGVGALGLAALSQTGIFDKEELGDTPPEIAAGIQDLRAYNERPLRVGEQAEYSFDPSLGKPVGVTQFKPMKPRNKSLAQVLEDLNKNRIAYSPSSISFG